MPKSNGEWKINQAKFQGYVKHFIEISEKRQDNLDQKLEKIYKKLENNTKVIERLKIKIGIIVAGLTAFFTYLWNKFMG